jgi:hypothetical protein
MSCESKKRIGTAIGVAFTVLVLLLSGMASAERIDIPADYATIKSALRYFMWVDVVKWLPNNPKSEENGGLI